MLFKNYLFDVVKIEILLSNLWRHFSAKSMKTENKKRTIVLNTNFFHLA